MVSVKVRGGMDAHEISFTENRRTHLAVAWCTCGWRRAGALETVQALAASHDIEEEEVSVSIMGGWSTRMQEGMREWQRKKSGDWGDQPRTCFCIGPQDGAPLCPCRMRARAREREEMRKEILTEIEAGKKSRNDL